MAETTNSFDQWGIVEVMGHKKYAGHITEETIAGTAFVRIDVPAAKSGIVEHAPFTKLIGSGSIYMITPTSEDIARRVAQQLAHYVEVLPVHLPPELQLASVTSPADVVDDDENGGWRAEADDDDDDLH